MNYSFPRNLDQSDITALKEKIPIIKSNEPPTHWDSITTRLRWPIHEKYDLHTTNKLLIEFLSSRESLKHKIKINKYNWSRRARATIINNDWWWLAAEYYFIDYLMRNSLIKKEYSLSHRKGPHIIDHIIKADVISALTLDKKTYLEDYIFWTQVHYTKIKQKYFEASKAIVKKEKDIYNWIVNNWQLLGTLSEDMRPQIPCLVRLNSELLQRNCVANPDVDNKFLFRTAFNDWENKWFDSLWPTVNLPYEYREFLYHMWYFYQDSCKSFIDFIAKVYSWNDYSNEYEPIKKFDTATRLSTFNDKTKRVTYDFFTKRWKNQKLMSIAFRITDAFDKRMKLQATTV